MVGHPFRMRDSAGSIPAVGSDRPFSSVAERRFCKPGVAGSIPVGGSEENTMQANKRTTTKTKCQHGQLIDPSLRCEQCEQLRVELRRQAETAEKGS